MKREIVSTGVDAWRGSSGTAEVVMARQLSSARAAVRFVMVLLPSRGDT
jgi:hypothetical protein